MSAVDNGHAVKTNEELLITAMGSSVCFNLSRGFGSRICFTGSSIIVQVEAEVGLGTDGVDRLEDPEDEKSVPSP